MNLLNIPLYPVRLHKTRITMMDTIHGV